MPLLYYISMMRQTSNCEYCITSQSPELHSHGVIWHSGRQGPRITLYWIFQTCNNFIKRLKDGITCHVIMFLLDLYYNSSWLVMIGAIKKVMLTYDIGSTSCCLFHDVIEINVWELDLFLFVPWCNRDNMWDLTLIKMRQFQTYRWFHNQKDLKLL